MLIVPAGSMAGPVAISLGENMDFKVLLDPNGIGNLLVGAQLFMRFDPTVVEVVSGWPRTRHPSPSPPSRSRPKPRRRGGPWSLSTLGTAASPPSPTPWARSSWASRRTTYRRMGLLTTSHRKITITNLTGLEKMAPA